VTNRLKEIKSLEGTIFKHVSSADNPADLATRGKYPKELTSSIWWMGPTWLSYPQEKWPISKIDCSEMKRNNVLFEASLLSREDLSREIPELLDLSDINGSRYLSLLKFYRVTAWILRFVKKLKKREHHSGPLESKVEMGSLHPV